MALPVTFNRLKLNNKTIKKMTKDSVRMFIVGSSGSGKTTWFLAWLEIAIQYYDRIVIFGTKGNIDQYIPYLEETDMVETDVTEELLDTYWDEAKEIAERHRKTQQTPYKQLFVFDDQLDAYRWKTTRLLYTAGRHEGISGVFLAQSYALGGTNARQIRQNLTHFIQFNNVLAQEQIYKDLFRTIALSIDLKDTSGWDRSLASLYARITSIYLANHKCLVYQFNSDVKTNNMIMWSRVNTSFLQRLGF